MNYYLKILLYRFRGIWQIFLMILIFLALCFFGFILSINAEGYSINDIFPYFSFYPFDYCYLTDVDYTAVLQDANTNVYDEIHYNHERLLPHSYAASERKARLKITEYLTYDVHAFSKINPFKELWRELPEDNIDGLNVGYNVESVSQILPDGTEKPYTETSKMYWEDSDYSQTATRYWHHSKKSGFYPDNDESLLMYIPWTYRDKLKFKIVYYMNNAVLKYNDCSELYLSFYSGAAVKHLNSLHAQVLIPDYMMPEDYYAYSYGTSKTSIPFEESKTENYGYNTFSIDLKKKDLKFNFHNRFIEFCLLAYGKDKHSIAPDAPNNLYSSQNVLDECIEENEYYTNRNITYNKSKLKFLVYSIIISAMIVAITIYIYKKTKGKYTFYEPENDYQYFRDIPSDLDPFFASELVFMKDPYSKNKEKGEEYAALLLSLVRKKYITLSKYNEFRDWTKSNTCINLEPIYYTYTTPTNLDEEPSYVAINKNTSETLEPLATSERLYLNLIEKCTHTSSITIEKFENNVFYYENTSYMFVKDMEKEPMIENGVAGGYFQGTDYNKISDKYKKASDWLFGLALVFIILVNFVSYFTPYTFCFGAYTIIGLSLLWSSLFISSKLPELTLFTQFGKNEQAKWYGLYNFLNSDTLINEREVHELPLWEKYLIYGTAFGISDKVIKALKIHMPELNIDISPILAHHSFIHSSSFHRTSRSCGYSIHTSSRASASFGGHGYGGGGRGGGGGGGGH